jgi:2-iminobutanoate/2-iminopropanoate deaminase
MIEQIHTASAPEAIGPYSQAVAAHSFVFCSGQLGIDPASGSLADGIENQTRQALANMKAVLEAAGSSVAQTVKTTMFLKSIGDFSAVNTVYGEFFGGHRPARSTVEVSNLPRGALVEIECTAAL